MGSSKIIQLTSENVKRLKAVEITPKGHVVVIGGKNGAGKSSVLDSIAMALEGGETEPMPVHKGELKARIVVDLGDIIVRRTFTANGGTSLVVTDAEGVKQSSPQAILDKLTGRLTFDPLEFAKLSEKRAAGRAEQAFILRELVGLDFTALDDQIAKLTEERRALNRETLFLKGRLEGMTKHPDAPEAEIPAAQILEEQQAAASKNASNAAIRQGAAELGREAEHASDRIEADKGTIETAKKEIARWQKTLADRLQDLERHTAEREAAAKAAATAAESAAALVDLPLDVFAERLDQVQKANNKFRQNAARVVLADSLKEKTAAADSLTLKLAGLESDKRRTCTAAKYPIEGLRYDSVEGVLYNDIPFSQASSAEQLRVSVAIGLALNPTLKVLLIRDGSLLDEDSMKLLVQMAKAADAQVWLERVGTDATTSVIIEDGQVKEVV